MKLFNPSLAGLLLIAGLASPLYISAASPVAKPKQAVRYLLLAENSDGGGNECKIEITKTESIDFNPQPPGCENDEMSYYKLDNVQSATRILFRDDPCGDDHVQSWEFQIYTYIQPVSSNWLPIEDLRGRAEGDIVSRGIRMRWSNDNGGQIRGKLSCVRITVSDPG
ncbi:hypothetical protein ACCD10_28730 [Pseudomonas sp. Pseusp122]|uniref:hypothetical protein n=1 Tax=unclassified Pseudomonas TaxID=196821 RepID=UPI0039A54779